MIGIFDSGEGGLCALEKLRELNQSVDICFFADRENAPYGEKTKEELTRLAASDIKRLLDFGADEILIACCTASTVWESLCEEYKRITTPIIKPTAEAAAKSTKTKNIGVIATRATAKSRKFTDALHAIDKALCVYEMATPDFVTMAETASPDRKKIEEALLPLRDLKIDTLILGCTHFTRLENEIAECLSGVKLIHSSYEGAKEIAKKINYTEMGKTYFL